MRRLGQTHPRPVNDRALVAGAVGGTGLKVASNPDPENG